MKKIHRFSVLSFFLVIAYLLSACAGAAAATPVSNGGGDKPLLRPVTYVGLVENIVGNQWTINGVTVTVGSDVLRDGPFAIGDQVKVEGVVNQDGSVTVSRVEAASADDLSTLPQLGDNVNTNDDNGNDASLNNVNSNDDNGNDASLNNSNSNDDNGNDAVIINSNDSNSNDSTSVDDNGNDSNSNTNSSDDHGGSDDSGSNSNDDHGGNGNDDNSNG